ncbi:GIY-YIG nuclease family protein [Nocardioides dongxiaopingii]|uniref:GIY-YIG nuclease family protein n=1 Tax=Nocardioides sp. S-1144 TaxID=2582905 RepID=UPI00110D46FD|nr:GIY-YIG nuclease family protein [Nocardioides sp. S-1144]QCW50038.1 GIY-YIG nuclease family protein [Nocardioides sp. S-1144]
MAWTYLLECADGSYYAGSTTQPLETRESQHNLGLGSRYTRRPGRRPVRLVWHAEFPRVEDAFRFEKQIQGWSRAKKQALIAGEHDQLPGLARGRGRPAPPSAPAAGGGEDGG